MLSFIRTKGRLNRIEFLIFSLVLFILLIANSYVRAPEKLVNYFIAFTLTYSYLTQSVRRAHDFNGSGYLYFFWILIPFFNIYAFFELYLRKGDIETNKHGKPPLFRLGKSINVQNDIDEDFVINEKRNEPSTQSEEKIAQVKISERNSENSIIIKLLSNSAIKWRFLVNEGDFIKKEQAVINVKSGDYFENDSFSKDILSTNQGYIHICCESYTSNYSYVDSDFFTLYTNDIDRQTENFPIRHQTTIDKFTKEEKIIFENVYLQNRSLSFRLESVNGECYICFEYSYPVYKLSENDVILFLLSNEDVIEFHLSFDKYKITNQTRGFRLPLFEEELQVLCNWDLEMVRVNIISDNQIIDLNRLNNSTNLSLKDFQFIVKNTFLGFKKAVIKLDNYKLLLKSKYVISEKEQTEKCSVYLMFDTTNNHYKIGISNNPFYRERTLQSEKPTIELICQKQFPTRKIAESFEKALHKAYEENRLRGEWFSLDDKAVQEITNTLK